MSWIVEQPIVILFVGAFLVAASGAIWVQTRDRRALIAVGSVVVLTGLWLLVERLVMTDVEQVKQTIRLIASEIENNNVEAVVNHISAENPSLRDEIRKTLSLVTVKKVSVKRNLKATVTRRAAFTSAEARFNAVATVEGRSGLVGTHVVPRFLVVRLRKEGQQWRVRSYEMSDPRDGLRGNAN
jgi:hypothetical protein